MRRTWGLALATLAVLLFLIATPVRAFEGGIPDGQVVFGEDFTLESGEVLDGDLVVFGGDVTLEEGSEVDGNVVVWGGETQVAGLVDGDLVVFGGDVTLAATAVVDGNLATMGGEVHREEGAVVRGQEVTAGRGTWSAPVVIPIPGFRRTIPLPAGSVPWGNGAAGLALRVFLRGARLLLMVLLMAGLSGLAVVLWPAAATRVGQAATRAPLPSLGVGLLTVVVAFVVVLGLAVTLCLLPVSFLVALAGAGTAIFGWTSLGIIVGERVLAATTPRTVSPFWSAALGGGLLTLLSGLLDLIPCVGWMGGFLVACVGIGAVVLTRFGTVEYLAALSAGPPQGQEEPEQ